MIKKGETIFEGKDFRIVADENYAGIEDLRRLINKKGFSMRQVGAHLGVNASTICRWLNGKTKPHPVLMGILCSVVEDLNRLYEDAPGSDGPATVMLLRLARLTRKYPGTESLPDEALNGLELMPSSLFEIVLSSNAPWPEILAFLSGFGEIAERSNQIVGALLEKGRKHSKDHKK